LNRKECDRPDGQSHGWRKWDWIARTEDTADSEKRGEVPLVLRGARIKRETRSGEISFIPHRSEKRREREPYREKRRGYRARTQWGNSLLAEQSRE